MLLYQINRIIELFYQFLTPILALSLVLIVVVTCLVLLTKMRAHNKQMFNELSNLKLRERDILESINFQQLSVTNIGLSIQSVIADEFELQNSCLLSLTDNAERRVSLKANWHKVLELSERLAHFTLRNVHREDITQTVNTTSVFAQNEAMLHSIVNANKQHLEYKSNGHATLNMPDGALDKILRGVIFHTSKAASPNTKLKLSCDISSSHFHFCIRGWGAGISAQEIHNIDVSVRTNPRFLFAKRAQDNEGDLNLASVQRLVVQFGGSVKLISALKYGIAIYVSIPLTGCAYPTQLTSSSTSSDDSMDCVNDMAPSPLTLSAGTYAKHKILIIDQSETSQMILHRALQKRFQCYACVSPLDSMQMIHNIEPSVILIDQITQGIEPLELIKLIRENPMTQHIPIIVCCGLAVQSFKLSALKLGATCILEKPVVQTELQLMVDSCIQQQQLVAEKVGEKLSEYHSQQLDIIEPDTFESGKDKGFIVKFNEMMQENFANENFTREIAAAHMSVCPRTLNRRLNEYYSHNFKEHLKKFRLEQAKTMLTKGATINEASLDVGFNSASYFSTCFKAEYGFSPSRLVSQCA